MASYVGAPDPDRSVFERQFQNEPLSCKRPISAGDWVTGVGARRPVCQSWPDDSLKRTFHSHGHACTQVRTGLMNNCTTEASFFFSISKLQSWSVGFWVLTVCLCASAEIMRPRQASLRLLLGTFPPASLAKWLLLARVASRCENSIIWISGVVSWRKMEYKKESLVIHFQWRTTPSNDGHLISSSFCDHCSRLIGTSLFSVRPKKKL